MKVLVSACLLGENCKYNGKNNRNEAVLRFVEDKEVISSCPELLTGLGAPRTPVEQGRKGQRCPVPKGRGNGSGTDKGYGY